MDETVSPFFKLPQENKIIQNHINDNVKEINKLKRSVNKSVPKDGIKKLKLMKKNSKPRKLTDFEQQYLDFKLNHMDKLLLIQIGYRYKLFGNDAKIASIILNLKLINGKLSFDLNNPDALDNLYSNFAQVSIPIERLLIHVRRLIQKGYKVGIINQVDDIDSVTNKKLFKRKLSHVYSPGTFIHDDDLLINDNNSNKNGNSIICINEYEKNKFSMVSVNVFFQSVIYDEFSDNSFTRSNLDLRLNHLEPIEILIFGKFLSDLTLKSIENFKKINTNNNLLIFKKDNPNIEFNKIILDLKSNFKINDKVFSFLLNLDINLLKCFHQLYNYLLEYNLSSVFNFIENFKEFKEVDDSTILNASILKNLDIFRNYDNLKDDGSLFKILNFTYTNYGQRLLKYWLLRPLVKRELILDRNEAVQAIIDKFNSVQLEKIKKLLQNSPDLEIISSKINYKKSNRKEIYIFLKKLNDIINVFKSLNINLYSKEVLGSHLLYDIFQKLKLLSNDKENNISQLFQMINSQYALDDEHNLDHLVRYFNKNFERFDIIQSELNSLEIIKNKLNDELTNIKKITKNYNLEYVKINNEEYLIQIRNSDIINLPQGWIKINKTTNCTRFRTLETQELYNKLKSQKIKLKIISNSCFDDFMDLINLNNPITCNIIRELASLDVLISFAKSAIKYNFNKPFIVDFPLINIKNGRNPITENILKLKKIPYIENDFRINDKSVDNSRIGLITGPNMGGKSSFVKQIGIICILSQIGSFIPCDKGTILGIFNSFFIRFGSSDEIFNKKSTFLIELQECKEILDFNKNENRNTNTNTNTNKNKNLILIDELGRGTSTTDGFSIAWSVLKYFLQNFDKESVILYITHFKGLENFEKISNGIIKNYFMGYKKRNDGSNDLMFTYKLNNGYSNGSFGIYCAKIAGIPKNILIKANQISKNKSLDDDYKKVNKIIKLIKNENFENLFDIIDTL